MNPSFPPPSKTAGTVSSVVLVDDHSGMRQMMKFILSLDKSVNVVGEAGGGCEGLKVCRSLKPDVVVLDLGLSDLAGLHVLRALGEAAERTKALIYTGCEDGKILRTVLRADPAAFVHKTEPLDTLRSALAALRDGGRFLSPYAAALLGRQEPLLERLTSKEVAVLQMIAKGMITKEIAEVLDAKPKTVDHHRQHIMDKLGLHDVASLTKFAIDNDLR